MKYDLVIFDLDGTILDTIGELTISFNYALSRSGIDPVTVEVMRSRVGNGARVLVQRSIEGISNVDEDKILSDYRSYYNEHCVENTDPFPGITDLLITLKSHGIKTAVVTNKSDPPARKLCARNFPGLIDIVQGHMEGLPHKPDPTIVDSILKRLDVSREKTVIVGDSETDIRTAINLGIDYICVDWGYKDRDVLIENGAGTIVSSTEELCEIILGE